MKLPKAAAGIVLMLIIVALSKWVPPAEGEFEFQTTYRIMLHKDSSATWVIELSTTLNSQDDLDDFKSFENNTDRATVLSSFESIISSIVGRAASLTGRLMRAENFSLSIYTSGIIRQRGVIEYRFTWVNFSLKTSETIEVGDVFEGGFYLFPNETLEIHYSELDEDYFLKFRSPQPSGEDVSRVIWRGKMDFPDGEPKLVFQSRIIRVEEFFSDSTRIKKGSSISVQGKISPPTPGLTIQIVYRSPEGLYSVREVTVGDNGVFSDTLDVDTAGEWGVSLRLSSGSPYRFSQTPQQLQFSVYEEESGSEAPSTVFPMLLLAMLIPPVILLVLLLANRFRGKARLTSVSTLSDEDRVIKLLKDAGGRLTQTQIKEATKFSKSKTSIVLNGLQKKGLIRKIKRGREYIVELV